MPLPLQNPVVAVEPNTFRYDLSISSRIVDGRLAATIGIALHPANCDAEGRWSDYPLAATIGHMIPDLDQFCVENPDLAVAVGTAYELLNQAVGAINEKLKLV